MNTANSDDFHSFTLHVSLHQTNHKNEINSHGQSIKCHDSIDSDYRIIRWFATIDRHLSVPIANCCERCARKLRVHIMDEDRIVLDQTMENELAHVTACIRCQVARRIEDKPECDKMIRDVKKRYELSSVILFPLSTCNFNEHGVLQKKSLCYLQNLSLFNYV
jgi:hypothetical protein